jgi:hypothetical protein
LHKWGWDKLFQDAPSPVGLVGEDLVVTFYKTVLPNIDQFGPDANHQSVMRNLKFWQVGASRLRRALLAQY